MDWALSIPVTPSGTRGDSQEHSCLYNSSTGRNGPICMKLVMKAKCAAYGFQSDARDAAIFKHSIWEQNATWIPGTNVLLPLTVCVYHCHTNFIIKFRNLSSL